MERVFMPHSVSGGIDAAGFDEERADSGASFLMVKVSLGEDEDVTTIAAHSPKGIVPFEATEPEDVKVVVS
jgi:hypothetical protein